MLRPCDELPTYDLVKKYSELTGEPLYKVIIKSHHNRIEIVDFIRDYYNKEERKLWQKETR